MEPWSTEKQCRKMGIVTNKFVSDISKSNTSIADNELTSFEKYNEFFRDAKEEDKLFF